MLLSPPLNSSVSLPNNYWFEAARWEHAQKCVYLFRHVYIPIPNVCVCILHTYVKLWGHSCLGFGLCLFICSKLLCPVIYERKFKFPGTRKGNAAGLEGEEAWCRKKWLSQAGIQPEMLPRTGSLGAQETETPFWGDLQSDSHSQQTFPRCTAENRNKNTKTLFFKAELQELKSHSLLYECPPACQHTIKHRLVEIDSPCFYSCYVNMSRVTWHSTWHSWKVGVCKALSTLIIANPSWQPLQKSQSQTVIWATAMCSLWNSASREDLRKIFSSLMQKTLQITRIILAFANPRSGYCKPKDSFFTPTADAWF